MVAGGGFDDGEGQCTRGFSSVLLTLMLVVLSAEGREVRFSTEGSDRCGIGRHDQKYQLDSHASWLLGP